MSIPLEKIEAILGGTWHKCNSNECNHHLRNRPGLGIYCICCILKTKLFRRAHDGPIIYRCDGSKFVQPITDKMLNEIRLAATLQSQK